MLRLKAILLYILSFIVLIAPLAFLIYWRRELYFVESNPTHTTVGFITALVFVVFLILKGFGSLNKDFKVLITLGILTGIILLLSVVVQDLIYIMPCMFMGWALFIVPKWIADRYWKKADIYGNQFIVENVKKKVRKKDDYYDSGNA